MMVTEFALLSTIDVNLADLDTRQVYADWLEDQGRDDEAYSQRWMAAWKKWPQLRVPERPKQRIIKPFMWQYYFSDTRHEIRHYHLPRHVFKALGKPSPAEEKLYFTVRAAETAITQALSILRHQSSLDPTGLVYQSGEQVR